MVIAPSPVRTPPSLEERLRQLDIRSPIDPEAASRWRAAPCVAGINGKIGGFLGNRKANAEVLLKDVKELMEQRYELGGGIALDKYLYSRPAAPDVIESLAARCDFVVTAIAD